MFLAWTKSIHNIHCICILLTLEVHKIELSKKYCAEYSWEGEARETRGCSWTKTWAAEKNLPEPPLAYEMWLGRAIAKRWPEANNEEGTYGSEEWKCKWKKNRLSKTATIAFQSWGQRRLHAGRGRRASFMARTKTCFQEQWLVCQWSHDSQEIGAQPERYDKNCTRLL